MFEKVLSSLRLLFPADIGILDFIQIIIIYIVLYYCIKTMRGTRAWILAKGVAIIGAVYVFFMRQEWMFYNTYYNLYLVYLWLLLLL